MAYAKVLSALADPTRRRIFETLTRAPRTVGELAASRPVSRPAVSQHLKVLERANLVQAERQGTRRLYSIRRDGITDLRRYLDGFWSEALDSYSAEIGRRLEQDRKRRST